MDNLGSIIRKLRIEKKHPLRAVATSLEIDQAILSKIERGHRKPTRELVVKIAKYFKVKENDLLVAWLSDKLFYEIEDEDMALKALQVAEERVAYKTFDPTDYRLIIKKLTRYFKNDERVAKAWIFGSFARQEYNLKSDVDIMVRYSPKASGTLLDYADIQYNLGNLLSRKVDLAEEGYIKPFAWNNIKKDLKLIYG